LENLKGRDHSEDFGVDGRIILKWILGNRVWECGLYSSAPLYGPMAGVVNVKMNLRVP
jgi:hypothetical protein